ncbi:hypothetical protein [Microbacterium trichothecenolyticum]|uniref:Uncharacterized protein n=1 Tax=Microbacterium trichothecenolyticum TaxID=69370 RepID=A0A0M2HLP5_MICTR|nr:hypothetical protein [Microbacterium trichothecenolyticum]KJL45826.1 hypothetical protein RS82_00033 [Microbacterium trichothecenolyticum]
MIRGLLILIGVTLVVAGILPTLIRLHADGVTALAILGFLIVVLAKYWPTAPTPQ